MSKALVVDDSSTVRSIISKLLNHVGILSIQAKNGREALAVLEQNPDIELILVDWNMPEMNGIEFVKSTRGESKYDSIKIVMVTTETEMHQVQLALQAGIDEYIMKPFTREIFEEKLSILGFPQTLPNLIER